MINQGQKVKFREQEAYANAFTTEEMYAIFMSLNQTKEFAEEVLKTEFPIVKKLSLEQQSEKEELQSILKHVNSSISKIKSPFSNIGVEI